VADVLVYATAARAEAARRLLGVACRATGAVARVEVFNSSGSLFGRLTQREGPRGDLVLGFGPYLLQAAALEGLLEPYRPRGVTDTTVHHTRWLWTGLESAAWWVAPGVPNLQELGGARRLALPDPARSEVGIMAVLATLDYARRVEGDPDGAWSWWQRRIASGVVLTEDAATPAAGASHVLRLGPLEGGAPLTELAAMPHPVALLAGARNADAARALIDQLIGAAPTPTATEYTDVEWTLGQYRAVRERWLSSGWSPSTG
jgi:hypothetical protein